MTLFSPFNIVIISLWFLSALADYSEFCYLWQLKEYRLDRMRDFFSTKQGKLYWLRYPLFWRTLIALVVFGWPFNRIPMLKSVILLIFTTDLLYNLIRFIRGQIRYPKPTPKAALLVLSCLLLSFGVSITTHEWNLVLLLMVGRFFIVSAMVILLNFATRRVKEWIIWRATQKIFRYPNLVVIGITGSYGKSSVKEYISQILAEKYQVINTPGNTNTDIGVAKFILGSDFQDKQIFVVEMGAYQIGEIKKICQIVKPRVGILTAIIEQHLSLFGSIANIQQAKYELLRAIPKNGLVITNADNPYCTGLLTDLECERRETFGEDIKNVPDCLISEVEAESGAAGVTWQIDYQGETHSLAAPLFGPHQPSNVTPVLMVAKYFDLTFTQIEHAVSHLRSGSKALSVYQYGQATIIDDTYNSNPKGFQAALSILNSFPSTRRRIVITRGMMELAEKTREYHEQIGEEISFSADELVIITPDFVDDFKAGITSLKDKYRLKEVKTIFSPTELLEYIKKQCHEPVIILLENRLPMNVYLEVKGTL